MANFSLPNAVPADGDAAIPSGDRAAALLHALERQLALFEKLHTLSQRQGSLIGAEDGAPLLQLLSDRQEIIDQLQAVQQHADANDLTAAPLSPTQSREASELTELIAAVRARILEQDECDRAALRDARNQVGVDLRKVAQGGQASKAYTGSRVSNSPMMPTVSRFTDRKG